MVHQKDTKNHQKTETTKSIPTHKFSDQNLFAATKYIVRIK